MTAQLFAVLVACVIVAVTLDRRLDVALCVVLWLHALVPNIAAPMLTGVNPSNITAVPAFHPASWLVIVLFAQRLVRDSPSLAALGRRHRLLLASLGTFLLVAVGTSVVVHLGRGVWAVVEEIGVSSLFLMLLVLVIEEAPRARGRIVTTVLAIGVVEVAIGVLDLLAHRSLVYEEAYQSYVWYGIDSRQFGTMDHPLVLSAFLLLCIALVADLRSAPAQAMLIGTFAVGILITQSRVGAALSIVGVASILLARRTSLPTRILILSVGAATACAIALTGLADPLFNRFLDDRSSAQARSDAGAFFWSMFPQGVIIGRGGGQSFLLSSEAGLRSSFESMFFIYSVDFGVGATILLILTFVSSAVFSYRSRLASSGASVGLLLLTIDAQSFSSLGAVTFIGPTVFAALALAVGRVIQLPGGGLQAPALVDFSFRL